MNARLTQCVLAIALAALMLPARASVLTFDNMGVGGNSPVPQGYGDNVATLPGGPGNPNITYTYGTAYGPTPDITADYAPATGNTLDFWAGVHTFGDLTNVLYKPDGNTTGSFFSVTLMAAPGSLVNLESFDLAADANNITLGDLKVIVNGVPDDIGTNITLSGASDHASSVHEDFTSAPLTGSMVEIQVIGGASLGNIAIDNIAFAEETPEPASLGLLAAGSVLLLRRRRV